MKNMAIDKNKIKMVHVPILGEPTEKIRERAKGFIIRDYKKFRYYRYYPPKVYGICEGSSCGDKKCKEKLYSTNEFIFYL